MLRLSKYICLGFIEAINTRYDNLEEKYINHKYGMYTDETQGKTMQNKKANSY